jgi:predicted dienelactone hydrolase
MRQAVLDPANAINRPLDVSFAIDQLGTMHTSAGPLRGKLDLARIGMAGHSFGAWTALAIAGQQFGPNQRMLADKRVKAAVAMSAPAPAQRSGKSFSQVRIPILHMTGTLDDSPIGETAAKDRRVPFDLITNAPEFLITFDGGDHMVFSGETRPNRNRVFDEEIHDLIRAGTLAFWDAWLRDEPKAKAWLEQDFSQVLGARGTIEKRLPAVIH